MGETINHRVSRIDENHLLYGNFIGLQYVFAEGLDEQVLAKSVEVLTKQFPALARRYSAKSNAAVTPPLKNTSLSVHHPASLMVRHNVELLKTAVVSPDRQQFIVQPRRKNVLRGVAPLSTFTLTTFKDGAAIFGIAISHILTDAAGFHSLMKHLGDIYSALKNEKPVPEFPYATPVDIFEFGTQRSKAETLDILKQRGLPKPIPIKGLLGKFIKSLIIKAMDKSLSDNPPISIHFTPEDVARLKQTVLTESGEDWIRLW